MHLQRALVILEQAHADDRGNLENRADLRAGCAFFNVLECRAADAGTIGQLLCRHLPFRAPDTDQLAKERKRLAGHTGVTSLALHGAPAACRVK